MIEEYQIDSGIRQDKKIKFEFSHYPKTLLLYKSKEKEWLFIRMPSVALNKYLYFVEYIGKYEEYVIFTQTKG